MAATPRLPVIHRTVATSADLAYYLNVWTLRRNARMGVLWLAFHGSPGKLHLGVSGRKTVTLDWLEDRLADRAHGKLIHLGSCSALRGVHGIRLNRFLRVTGALAVSGFTREVEWFQSSMFETMFMAEVMSRSHSRAGLAAVDRWRKREVGSLSQSLGFRLCVRPL